jgi:hypothetical protein
LSISFYDGSDFQELRLSLLNYFFSDNTDLCEAVVAKDNKALNYYGPAKFGKSFTLSMLECFFDISKKELFPLLFEGLKAEKFAEKDTTKSASSYHILKFNFIAETNTENKVDFGQKIIAGISGFCVRYNIYSKFTEWNQSPNASYMILLTNLKEYASQQQWKILVIIDEFDRTLMSHVIGTLHTESNHKIIEQNIKLVLTSFTTMLSILKESKFKIISTGIYPLKIDDESFWNIDHRIQANLGFNKEDINEAINKLSEDQQTRKNFFFFLVEYCNGYLFVGSKGNCLHPTLCMYIFKQYLENKEFRAIIENWHQQGQLSEQREKEIIEDYLTFDNTEISAKLINFIPSMKYASHLLSNIIIHNTTNLKPLQISFQLKAFTTNIIIKDLNLQTNQELHLISLLYHSGILTLSSVEEMESSFINNDNTLKNNNNLSPLSSNNNNNNQSAIISSVNNLISSNNMEDEENKISINEEKFFVKIPNKIIRLQFIERVSYKLKSSKTLFNSIFKFFKESTEENLLEFFVQFKKEMEELKWDNHSEKTIQNFLRSYFLGIKELCTDKSTTVKFEDPIQPELKKRSQRSDIRFNVNTLSSHIIIILELKKLEQKYVGNIINNDIRKCAHLQKDDKNAIKQRHDENGTQLSKYEVCETIGDVEQAAQNQLTSYLHGYITNPNHSNVQFIGFTVIFVGELCLIKGHHYNNIP